MNSTVVTMERPRMRLRTKTPPLESHVAGSENTKQDTPPLESQSASSEPTKQDTLQPRSSLSLL